MQVFYVVVPCFLCILVTCALLNQDAVDILFGLSIKDFFVVAKALYYLCSEKNLRIRNFSSETGTEVLLTC
jgi:hypothetical protein